MPVKPRPIGQILRSSREIERLLQETRQQAEITEQVRRRLPESLRPHLVAARLHRGELLLYADSPAWSSRLRYLSRDLKRQLLRRGRGISGLRVRVSLGDHAKTIRRERIRRLSLANARLLEQTAKHIDSPPLAAALRRLARHRED